LSSINFVFIKDIDLRHRLGARATFGSNAGQDNNDKKCDSVTYKGAIVVMKHFNGSFVFPVNILLIMVTMIANSRVKCGATVVFQPPASSLKAVASLFFSANTLAYSVTFRS